MLDKTKNLDSKRLSSFFILLSSKQRAFSLIEMMVAIFVFSLIMVTVVAAFSSVVSTRRNVSQNQRSLEAARTAMELIAKNLRMSKYAGPAGTGSEVEMYSSGKCIYYKFDSSTGKLEGCFDTSSSGVCNGCSSGYAEIISENISGSFYMRETNVATKTIGRATVSMKVGQPGQEKYLQTTVSFRDYEGIIQ